jgi:hypothetical protein
MIICINQGKKTLCQLIIADYYDRKFRYVLAGWKGSSQDANILADTIAQPDGINIMDDKC